MLSSLFARMIFFKIKNTVPSQNLNLLQTKEEYSNMFKTKVSSPDVINSEPFPISLEKLPEQVDWRESGAVTPVKDEGNCDASWAFSVVSIINSLKK